jgi:hypothetical protein
VNAYLCSFIADAHIIANLRPDGNEPSISASFPGELLSWVVTSVQPRRPVRSHRANDRTDDDKENLNWKAITGRAVHGRLADERGGYRCGHG